MKEAFQLNNYVSPVCLPARGNFGRFKSDFLRQKIKIAHFYICYVFWSEKSKYDVRISNFGSCWTPAAKKGLKFLSLDTGATNVVSTYFFYHCVRLPKASGGSPISTMTSISYRVFGQESPDNRLFSALQTLDAHI